METGALTSRLHGLPLLGGDATAPDCELEGEELLCFFFLSLYIYIYRSIYIYIFFLN